MAVQQTGIIRQRDGGPSRRGIVRWPSALVALAGVWLVISSGLLDHTGTGGGAWSDVVTGAALVVLASVRLAFPVRTAVLGLVNAALGVWVVISPFALHYQGASGTALANDLLVGIAVVVLATIGTITSSFAWQPSVARRRLMAP
jgi:hypothetical protein